METEFSLEKLSSNQIFTKVNFSGFVVIESSTLTTSQATNEAESRCGVEMSQSNKSMHVKEKCVKVLL